MSIMVLNRIDFFSSKLFIVSHILFVFETWSHSVSHADKDLTVWSRLESNSKCFSCLVLGMHVCASTSD